MSLLKLNSNGYHYTDVDGLLFFEEDSNHEALFKFVSFDLSKLPILLNNYFSKGMDIETFELKNYKYVDDDYKDIDELLLKCHPYFQHEYIETLISAIGDYFNALIIQSTYNKNLFYPVYDKDWYFLRFNALASNLIRNDNGFAEKYYKHYVAIINEDDDLPPLPPKGFYSIVTIQELAKLWLFWLLDASAPYINTLTISQRMWLYGDIFTRIDEQPELRITKQISFKNPHRSSHTSNYKRLEYINGVDHQFTLLGDLFNFHCDQTNIHPEALKTLIDTIGVAKERSSEEIYEEYEIEDLYQLIFLEVYQMILNNTLIKKCRHCNNYFVITNMNVEYCDRIATGEDKPCSAIGSKRAFQKKLEEDYPLKIYNRAYKTHYARVKNGRMTQAQFSSWCIEAKEKLTQARGGILSTPNFEQWLKI